MAIPQQYQANYEGASQQQKHMYDNIFGGQAGSMGTMYQQDPQRFTNNLQSNPQLQQAFGGMNFGNQQAGAFGTSQPLNQQGYQQMSTPNQQAFNDAGFGNSGDTIGNATGSSGMMERAGFDASAPYDQGFQGLGDQNADMSGTVFGGADQISPNTANPWGSAQDWSQALGIGGQIAGIGGSLYGMYNQNRGMNLAEDQMKNQKTAW